MADYTSLEQWLYDTGVSMPGDVRRIAKKIETSDWLARYRESVIDEVEDHLVRRDQFTERTLTVIDELREKK